MEKRLKLPINAVRPNKTLQVHESYSENRFKVLDNLNTPKTTGNFQNITFSFLAKQNEKLLKNKDKIILSSKLKKTNDNRRLFIDHPIKVSTHKTRKIDSIPRSKNSSTYVVSKSPYLRKIPKSQNFYVNKTKRNTETEIHNIFDLNYINSPTTIKKPKPCLYYGNMDLVNYDKNSEYTVCSTNNINNVNNINNSEYSLFDKQYLDFSCDKVQQPRLFRKKKRNSIMFKKNHFSIDKTIDSTCTITSLYDGFIKKNSSNNIIMKILCESFNIISKKNNKNEINEKNKLLKELKKITMEKELLKKKLQAYVSLEKKMNEIVKENKKIQNINNIVIRDNKLLAMKLKINDNKYTQLNIENQSNLLFERNKNFINYSYNFNKFKLILLLHEIFTTKSIKEKLLLFKFFNLLYLFSKISYKYKKPYTFIADKKDNFISSKNASKEKENYINDTNKKNRLLKSIILKNKLKFLFCANSFEKWKYKTTILKTMDFVKGKKMKKKEKSRQRKQRKISEKISNNINDNYEEYKEMLEKYDSDSDEERNFEDKNK